MFEISETAYELFDRMKLPKNNSFLSRFAFQFVRQDQSSAQYGSVYLHNWNQSFRCSIKIAMNREIFAVWLEETSSSTLCVCQALSLCPFEYFAGKYWFLFSAWGESRTHLWYSVLTSTLSSLIHWAIRCRFHDIHPIAPSPQQIGFSVSMQ